jgi:methylglutaconyl-CoA hydratase
MTYRFLQIHRDGPVEHVVLNRPEVRNAFNEQVIAEVTAWCDAVAADDDVRCAVLAGAGPVFCAGADLAWMSKMLAFTHEQNLADANAAARMFAALDRLPIPLIARVHGAALGGGAGLAAVCDVVVSDESAIFGFTEVKFGILPAMISPYVIGKIGQSATRHLFVTGARFSAHHARDIGLVHTVVAADDLDAQIAQYARELLSCGPEAIAAVKTLLRAVAHRDPADTVGITAEAIASRRVSAEGQEGMKAFLDKRKASWNVSPDSDRQSR